MLDKLSVLLASVLPSSRNSGRKELKFRGEICLNCDTPLDRSDRYCSNCSQLNSTKKLYLKDLFQEFFAGIFAYDGRFLLTLRTLLFRPGIISKDFVEGKRMRYANPFRFYLTISILFFIFSSVLNKIDDYSSKKTVLSNKKEIKSPAKTQELDSILSDKNVFFTSEFLNQIDSIPIKKRDSIIYYSEIQLSKMSRGEQIFNKIKIYNDYYTQNEKKQAHDAVLELGHTPNFTNVWLYKKIIDFHFFKNNKGFAINYFYSKLPIVIFLFLPVFAFFIFLLYVRKMPFTYMEHLVFAFHVQSFFFALLIITLFLDTLFVTSVFSSLGLLLFAFYIYKAMRNFYAQNRFKTIIKFFILNSLFSILATVATIVFILVSFSLY